MSPDKYKHKVVSYPDRGEMVEVVQEAVDEVDDTYHLINVVEVRWGAILVFKD